jgi:hypothetical protein
MSKEIQTAIQNAPDEVLLELDGRAFGRIKVSEILA